MSETTLGKLILETARGDEKQRRVSDADTGKLRREMAERVTPKIDSIRAEQRRAFEDSKSVVLF